MPKLTEKGWNEVYDVLIEIGGMHEDYRANVAKSDRAHFIRRMSAEEWIERVSEWRFQGTLGFGGKLWNNDNGLYITCYSEDKTPERSTTIEKMNERLNEIRKREEIK